MCHAGLLAVRLSRPYSSCTDRDIVEGKGGNGKLFRRLFDK